MKNLANTFLNAKAAARDAGESIAPSWQDYKDAYDLILKHFGRGRLVSDLGLDDFAELRRKMSQKWGPGTLGNVINRMRVAFWYASDNGLIDRPVRYGSAFKRPFRQTLRLDKAKKGPKLFTAEEVHRLIDAAGSHLRVLIVLGTNSGFGNADCGTRTLTAIDLDDGIIKYPRPKTGIPRRRVLSPETITAVRESLTCRPESKRAEHAGLSSSAEVF